MEKKKNKPDYTKFMKKPAPLEPIQSSDEAPFDSEPKPSSEEDIPLAEIISSQEENGLEEQADIRYFETVSTEEPGIQQTPAPPPQREPSYTGRERSSAGLEKSVPSGSSRKTHIAEGAEDIGTLAQLFCALQPPPIPVFIAPILLALLFLAF